ncbi:MAG: tetratricopeptide repeat protein [Acidobacteriota bacterium]
MTKHIPWILLLALTASLGAAPPNLGDVLREQMRLVAEQPADAALHNDLGNLLLLADDVNGAETAYRRATELDTEYVDAWFNLGLLLQQTERPSEAETVYRAMLELDPAYAWAHYQLGTLHHHRGDERKAVQAYAQAFALDTSLTFAEVNPDIIDNDLFTQALLRSAKLNTAPSARTPRQYADAGRIRELMLDRDEPLMEESAEDPWAEREPSADAMDARRSEAPVGGSTVRGGARFDSGDGEDTAGSLREVRRADRPGSVRGVGEDEAPRTRGGVTGIAVGGVPQPPSRTVAPQDDPRRVQPRGAETEQRRPPVYVPPQRRGAAAGDSVNEEPVRGEGLRRGAATGSTSSRTPASRGGIGRNSSASLELRLETPTPTR